MLPKFYPLLIFVLLLTSKAGAQDAKLDSIGENINRYALNTAQSNLFVHFDKNVYTNNDQVWFTAYLLKNITDLDQYHTLYLSLVNNRDSSIVLQEKFLIEKGFSFGGFSLPDSIPSGSYRFVANTNIKKNGLPEGEFIQPVNIRSTTTNPLTASISVFRAYDPQTKNGTALLKVITGNNRFVEQADIIYQIGKGKQVLIKGNAKSSVIGELMIDFPAERITTENNQLTATVKKGKDIRYLTFELPVMKRPQYEVKFYPEGGYLVNHLKSKVGFEIKDLEGTVLKAKALLYENDTVIDTIQSNSTGIGSFSILPDVSKKYTVKLLTETQQDIKYELPQILQSGAILAAADAINDNDFRIRLESNDNTKLHAIVHNYSKILLHSELILTANKAQGIRFKLDAVPMGLNTLTILDSNYRPIAERIFFAHYDQLNHTELLTDKNEYGMREQVNLKINIADRSKTPQAALVSIACVQSNRLSGANNQNIVDYFYLQQYLNALPNRPMGLKYVDRNYLNDILLVKTWSRYKWPQTQIEAQQNNGALSEFEYQGKITRKKKPLDKAIGLTTVAGENLNFFDTDDKGVFKIRFANLIVKEPRVPVWLGMVTANYDQYEIEISNPNDELKKYLQQQDYEMVNTKTSVLNESNQQLNTVAGIRLKDVVITKNRDETIHFIRNKCGDYVCRYNILNCPNHTADIGNSNPVIGKTYGTGRGGSVVYHGCSDQEPKSNITVLKGINLPKEFYVADITNKNEPINFATVYWNYQLLVKGDTAISFNTGDITGPFKIIVQGVTDGGVVYGEKEITVKEK